MTVVFDSAALLLDSLQWVGFRCQPLGPPVTASRWLVPSAAKGMVIIFIVYTPTLLPIVCIYVYVCFVMQYRVIGKLYYLPQTDVRTPVILILIFTSERKDKL